MKKTIAFILVLIIILGLAACGAAKEVKESKSLHAHGLDVVSMLSEMTRSENFIGIYTANSEIKDIILTLDESSYEQPDAVYAITVPENALTGMAELGELEGASEELKSFLMQRFMASLISQINAMSGAENLAASSICTVGKTFVSENAKENVIYIYVYEGTAPVAVTFTLGEDHTVSATGTFIFYDGFTCGSVEEIRSAFGDIPVKVTEVVSET